MSNNSFALSELSSSIHHKKGNCIMTPNKSFLERAVEIFTRQSEPKVKPHTRKRSLQLETLEAREMLSGIGISTAPQIVDEGQAAIIRIERDDSQGELSAFFELDYRNSGCYYDNYAGWARNGKDFDFLPGTNEWSYQGHVKFQDGQQYVDITVQAKTDTFLEGDEQISLRLINAGNYWGDRTGVSSNTTYTIDQARSSTSMTIKDTTDPVTVRVVSVQNGVEGGVDGSVRLERDNVENALTVYYKLDSRNSGYYYYTNQNPPGWARNGTDFEWLPGTDQYDYDSIGQVTFAAGERFADITFRVKDDAWLEGT
ncbi:MAG TPA: hypothetical protein DEB39_07285, partial [Planctomycetaceae bacterium]|nr:hypothetical protein [Planctomycetaceae bacterium]